jgi:predicted adenine nucleotide alpha hydrolase (AANH) superfamily ATPase
MLHGAGMRREPDSGRLCRSCFELLLKNAEQKAATGGNAQDSLNDFDEHLA